jgi:hypothetical protein
MPLSLEICSVSACSITIMGVFSSCAASSRAIQVRFLQFRVKLYYSRLLLPAMLRNSRISTAYSWISRISSIQPVLRHVTVRQHEISNVIPLERRSVRNILAVVMQF